MTEICNNRKTLPLRITVLCYTNTGTPSTYGRVITSMRDIEMREEPNTLELTSLRGKFAGNLVFTNFKINMRPSMTEYFNSGWCLETAVAIDFTLSNLEISNLKSLHRISNQKPIQMNQYEKAMYEVCKTLQPYSKNGMFAVQGFGGIPNYVDSEGNLIA